MACSTGAPHHINVGTHLLLATFVASTLDRLSSLIFTQIAVIYVFNASWGAVHPRNGDIALATLCAIGTPGGRRMINTRHYGTGYIQRILGLYFRSRASMRYPPRDVLDGERCNRVRVFGGKWESLLRWRWLMGMSMPGSVTQSHF
jgi:hypothetical protein